MYLNKGRLAFIRTGEINPPPPYCFQTTLFVDVKTTPTQKSA